MEIEGIDAILISKPENVLYLTGKRTGRVLISDDSSILWVKELYREIHKDWYFHKNYNFDVRIYDDSLIEEEIRKMEIRNLGIENMSFRNYNRLEKKLQKKLVITDILEKQRSVKSKYEINLMKKSAEIAKKGMERAYEVIQEGVKELDATAEIEYEIRKRGSETPPFKEGMLLASGASSANIHATPGEKRIGDNELVVVDLGARFSNYYSDMTRTIALGDLNPRDELLLESVKNLEMEAIDRVTPEVSASEIHKFVERKIKSLGYKFYHSTGHGIGLEVHEIPNLGLDSEDILKEDMVFTIEPGIYIPKKFGIRFEDMIWLKKSSVEILTR